MLTETATTSTRDRILTAAEAEFLDKGYAGARTTSIAAAAGVNHAMLHYYFHTKKHLFETIVKHKMSLLSELMLSSIGDTSLLLPEKLSRAISLHLDFIAANPKLPAFMINEVLGNTDMRASAFSAVSAAAESIVGSLQQQIDDYAIQGKCRAVDARMLIIDILSLNVAPYLLAPAINMALDNYVADPDFLESRKKENIETILRKLRP